MLSIEKLKLMWAGLGKKIDGVANDVSHAVYQNVNMGGQKGTITQVLFHGRRLKEQIRPYMRVPPKLSVQRGTLEEDRILDKWRPICPKNPTQQQLEAYDMKVNNINDYDQKHKDYPLTDWEKQLVCNLSRGKIMYSYWAFAYCNVHHEVINSAHMNECELFEVNG